MLPRQIAARADLHGERVVARRALDQHAEACVGEPRAGILGDRVHDVAVAARHQHVGDRFAQRLRSEMAARCCWLLLLALASRSDSLRRSESVQHRPRHVDVVVEGEHAHHAGRRGRHVGEPDRKLGARLGLDRGGELGDHLVEQADLLHRIAVGAGHEQVGDARQHLDRAGHRCRRPAHARVRRSETLGHAFWRVLRRGRRGRRRKGVCILDSRRARQNGRTVVKKRLRVLGEQCQEKGRPGGPPS